MRIPVSGNLSARDGTSNKNARLTNMLVEQKKEITKAVIRPGLNQILGTTGAGNGLVCFNGELVSVFGDAINMGITEIPGSSTITTTSGVFPKPLRQLIKLGSTWYAFINHQEYDHATVGGIWYSTDLVAWTEITSTRGYELNGYAFEVSGSLKCVMYHNTYDVDEDIDITDGKYRCTVSSGGSVNLESITDSYWFRPVLYANGYYYGQAYSSGVKFARSSDLESVTFGDAEPYGENIISIKYGGGKFWYSNWDFASPDIAYAMVSEDGLTWDSPITLASNPGLYIPYPSSVYANGEFIVYVNPDMIFKSTTGTTYDIHYITGDAIHTEWTRAYTQFVYNYNNGKYYLLGFFSDGTPDHPFYMATSTDAETWEDITPAGNPMIVPSEVAINGDDLIFGVSEGETYPFTYGLSSGAITASTYEVTNTDALINERIDFAIIP